VVVPITVLEELDQFNKGNGVINLQARGLGLIAEDYESVRIRDIQHLYKGERSELANLASQLLLEAGCPAAANAITGDRSGRYSDGHLDRCWP
jgi:predicted ribonuclease YlaK